MTLRVAIVGSGPSGFYAADALVRGRDDIEVDIIERLPTPYGLIRGGVAPDHQTTKNVSRNFEKTAMRDNVRYYGNVCVGDDLGLDELRVIYDAVILAVGAPHDNLLTIPGSDLPGVIGSAAFVGWYNGHPDFTDLDPPLDHQAVAVIGNGNVAIDVARVLTKPNDVLATTDIAHHAIAAIAEAPITDVYMIGRRGPVEAKFTNVELREMGDLPGCIPVVDADHLPDSIDVEMSDRDLRLKAKNLETLRGFTELHDREHERRVHFMFYAAPVAVLGDDRVTGLRLERTKVVDGRAMGTGEFFDIECGLVVPAIGYRSMAIEGVEFNHERGLIDSDDGRVERGLYVVGWVKRGPTGVIATNRPDGKIAADLIFEDFADGDRPGHAALEDLLRGRGVKWVTFEAWKTIEAAEVAAATSGAPRRKFTTIEDMLSALD
ncbi:MAG: FAD-dependent oxidoreductase [Alphaproteobacteria bacterium]|nr:FAD-dependent oxidoreductase [Alphaproteobacteria bacterium]